MKVMTLFIIFIAISTVMLGVKHSETNHNEFSIYYIPYKIFVGSIKESNLPLLDVKDSNENTMVYVCVNEACKLPVKNIEEALLQIK